MDDQFYQEVSGTERLVVAALVRLKYPDIRISGEFVVTRCEDGDLIFSNGDRPSDPAFRIRGKETPWRGLGMLQIDPIDGEGARVRMTL